MKKTAGFTLVELIVVIAILAILAGIAIPVYSGYISKAKEAADLQQLDAIKTAAVFAAVEADNDATVNYISVTKSDDAWGVAAGANEENAATVDVSDYVTISDFESDKYGNGATWSDGAWDGVSD